MAPLCCRLGVKPPGPRAWPVLLPAVACAWPGARPPPRPPFLQKRSIAGSFLASDCPCQPPCLRAAPHPVARRGVAGFSEACPRPDRGCRGWRTPWSPPPRPAPLAGASVGCRTSPGPVSPAVTWLQARAPWQGCQALWQWVPCGGAVPVAMATEVSPGFSTGLSGLGAGGTYGRGQGCSSVLPRLCAPAPTLGSL